MRGRRLALVLLPAGLAACAGPWPAAQPPARQWRGRLSRKGSAPGQYWAVEDDAGRQWRLAPSTALAARLPELQGRRVRLAGRLGPDPAGDEIEALSVEAE